MTRDLKLLSCLSAIQGKIVLLGLESNYRGIHYPKLYLEMYLLQDHPITQHFGLRREGEKTVGEQSFKRVIFPIVPALLNAVPC